MAYTKTSTDADTYFRPNAHLKGAEWAAVDPQDKQAAIEQAQRELELYTGRQMVDPLSSWTFGPRDDYAVFEQALWIIENLPRRGPTDAPVAVNLPKGDAGKEPRADDIGISPMAQRWLGRSRIHAVRG